MYIPQVDKTSKKVQTRKEKLNMSVIAGRLQVQCISEIGQHSRLQCKGPNSLTKGQNKGRVNKI